jgi:serine/threonine-protein kinase
MRLTYTAVVGTDATTVVNGHRPDDAIGAMVAERYEILEQLGRGGMGVVYRAFDRELEEAIALKVLGSAQLGQDRVDLLRREVRLARKVTHRNVARIHDIGVERGRWFLTMQLVDGLTLRQLLRRRSPLTVAEATEIAGELCEGLAAAHAAGVLHLDLKPENLMLPPGGGVVILDFGVARLAGDGGTTGEIGGTPGYMAPEQRLTGQADARSDLYAVGVLLHEMLAGELPREGGPDLGQLGGASPALAKLVAELLAFDPDERPQSARVVADALHDRPAAPWAERARSPRRLAVVPFRGAGDACDLANGLTEELTDRLTALRGVTVLATTAAYRLHGAGALEADALVEGSVRRTDNHVHVHVRLVDTSSAAIAWHEELDAPISNVLELQIRMAQRIAEALRVELTAQPYRGTAPAEAIERYMLARGKLSRVELFGEHGALADLDRVLALAPELAPAIALRALVAVRMWFFSSSGDVDHARAVATGAIADALARAPGLPETHLAAGAHALQNGDPAGAIRELKRTLELAPSQPLALEYMGRVLCEVGRTEEGLRHIELSAELDPTLFFGLLEQARHFALHRCWQELAETAAEVERRGTHAVAAPYFVQLRAAMWRGIPDLIERWASEAQLHLPNNRLLVMLAGVMLGSCELGELDAMIDEQLSRGVARRYAQFAHQIAAEAAGARGQPERALSHVERANALGLHDIEWIDLCPVLGECRRQPGFAELRRAVRERAAALIR